MFVGFASQIKHSGRYYRYKTELDYIIIAVKHHFAARQMPLKDEEEIFLLLKLCVDTELSANKQHFQINPHYCGQYVSPDLYFLVLEVTNNYNPTVLSEGPIES